MKKSCIVIILFVTLFPKLDAQIFYNIEKPLSYQKQGLIDIKELPSIKFDVDNTGNLAKDKISLNLKDYLKIEKNGEKNIARVKFNVASLSLGEMTLRFSNVKLNNGTYCYVYTTDYQIVAGPIYQKSINDMLNIVKIPANELILEIVSNSELDYNFNFSSIYFQSIEDIKQKNKNILQEDLSNWDCDNHGIDGQDKYFDNIGDEYNSSSASWVGAGNSCELFSHSNLHSITDFNNAAARASCVIIVPPYETTTWYSAFPGTLMNFPNNNCKGIVFSAYHHGLIANICVFTHKLNLEFAGANELSEEKEVEYTNYLDNVLIRFNFHHKYGKPQHLSGCNPADFELWRKSIDFDEVIDYCGVRGVAYGTPVADWGDYAIIKMLQTPFYKELHLGWTTQREFQCSEEAPSELVNYSDFTILGRHAATPTYLYTNSGASLRTYQDFDVSPMVYRAYGIFLKVINQDVETIPVNTFFTGWSGSQLLIPDYNLTPEKIQKGLVNIGLGLIMKPDAGQLGSVNYSALFNIVDCNIIDPDLPLLKRGEGDDLYTKYFSDYLDEFIIEDDYYWMPSVENREKCPSPLSSLTDPCNYHIGSHITVVKEKNGKITITLNITPSFQSEFPNGNMPKGIRIYNTAGDQKTFYFDSFADDIDITSTIVFTIDPCDIFYFKNIGCTPFMLHFDFYDADGKIINASGCAVYVEVPLEDVSLCDMMSITTTWLSVQNQCCTYEIAVEFNGCDDYSNIVRMMLEKLSLNDLTNNTTTPLSSLPGLSIDYLNGKISFIKTNICEPTSFQFSGLFDNNNDCESFDFDLNCVIPDPECDCCMVFRGKVNNVWGYEETENGPVPRIEPHKFVIQFTTMGNEYYQKRCAQCQIISAHVYCTNPNPMIPNPMIPNGVYDEIITPVGDNWSSNIIGSLEGFPPGTYCFNFQITTNSGICLSVVCVEYDGTNVIIQ